MTELELTERDEQVVQALEAGRSLRKVRKELGLTPAEFDAALERCFPLDTAARLCTIRGDLSRLDQLIEKLFLRAISGDGDANFATAAIRALERKAQMLGLDAVQRIDLQICRVQEVPSFTKIREAIFAVARDRQVNGDGSVPSLDGNASPSDGNSTPPVGS